jgi:hypothetical protein|tara:strand:+ start:155 stop:304 length:150 start_codon:yes stop_codon:yes gene_type:complete
VPLLSPLLLVLDSQGSQIILSFKYLPGKIPKILIKINKADIKSILLKDF